MQGVYNVVGAEEWYSVSNIPSSTILPDQIHLSNMRTLYAVLVLAVAVVTALEDHHKEVRAKCGKEGGFSDDQLAKFESNMEPAKCYLKCMMQELKIMDEQGNFSVEEAVNQIDESIRDSAKSGVTTCANTHKDVKDPCEHAYAVTKCFADGNADLFKKLSVFGPPPA